MFGRRVGESMVLEAMEHYRGFVPEMAAVPRGALNSALLGTYELLAYGLALRTQGASAERIGAFYEKSYQALSGRYPSFLLTAAFRLFRPFLIRRLRKEALASQASAEPGEISVESDAERDSRRDIEGTVPGKIEAPEPDGWKFDFIEPVSGDRGFGFDVQSCAVCSLFGRHGQTELVPYVCALDDAMSDAFGLGLRRTGTRAMGASCCDFRYEPGGEGRPLKSIRTFPVVD